MALVPPFPPPYALPWDILSSVRAPVVGSVNGLDTFSGGTFTRSSEGAVFSGAPNNGSSAVLSWAANDVRRIENRGDGRGDMLLVEGSRTNSIIYARNITVGSAGAWVGAASGPPVTSSVAGMDGATEAWRVQATTGQYTKFLTPPAGAGYISSWVRVRGANPAAIQYGNSSPITLVSASGNVWQRAGRSHVGGGSFTPIWCDTASTPGCVSPIDAEIDFHQYEVGAVFPSSPIRTSGSTATRATDALSYAAGAYPASFLTQGFRLTIAPDFSSDDVIAGTIGALVVFAFGANDLLYFRHSGGACQLALARGGAVVVNPSLTFSRQQLLTLTYVPGTGLTIAGATSGNGLAANAGSALPANTMTIGTGAAASNPFFGRFGRYIEAL